MDRRDNGTLRHQKLTAIFIRTLSHCAIPGCETDHISRVEKAYTHEEELNINQELKQFSDNA